MHVCVKMMSKRLKEALTVLIVTHTEYCYSFCYSCQKDQKFQILCMVLCIQGPSFLQNGRLFVI